ncbi:hypothetical protein CPB83DRAFT_843748 [Crepidotus variabilis]|uniref:Uncharacterized protein n=1 Tax=Crepidotus variabilis TaxID=179855 RepID=A0A9P6JVM2_9AGAR|nr:hypothetical protein CPB83DRAFT_843748 [Crepidotus variabilis]
MGRLATPARSEKSANFFPVLNASNMRFLGSPLDRLNSRCNRSALQNQRARNHVPQHLQDKLFQDISCWMDSARGASSSMMWIRGSEATDGLQSAVCDRIVNSYAGNQTKKSSKGNDSNNPDAFIARFFVPEPPNSAERDLVPTLTSQLIGTLPEIKKLVERQITLHPHIFYESQTAQMDALFMQPLRRLSHSGRPLTRLFTRKGKQSHLILVEGLHRLGDGDSEVQIEVLQMFSRAVAASKKQTIDLRVLVTSRAEPHLLSAMNGVRDSQVEMIDLDS